MAMAITAAAPQPSHMMDERWCHQDVIIWLANDRKFWGQRSWALSLPSDWVVRWCFVVEVTFYEKTKVHGHVPGLTVEIVRTNNLNLPWTWNFYPPVMFCQAVCFICVECYLAHTFRQTRDLAMQSSRTIQRKSIIVSGASLFPGPKKWFVMREQLNFLDSSEKDNCQPVTATPAPPCKTTSKIKQLCTFRCFLGV